MKAWGLFFYIVFVCAACAGCAMARDSPWAAPGELTIPATPVPDTSDPFRADQGVGVIRGMFAEGRQPDGNSAILATRGGLIVFDTGRHASHAQKIIDYALAWQRPVRAILNSHWHLDHISGNIALRARWPRAAVYSNDTALTEALGSFLARGLVANRKAVADPATPPGLAEDLRGDIVTVEHPALLHPTVSLDAAGPLSIDGRRLEIHIVKAASEGDLWIYDVRGKLVLTGDLVTLPAPFLDTACPANWRAELGAILATPFEHAIPGHGRVMTHADVALYSAAFNALLDCAASDEASTTCAEAWSTAVQPLLDGRSGDAAAASRYARYYVEESLRKFVPRAGCR